ncbi:MAG: glycosyltransferase family 39 protein, partial [Chloroflexi bacterium]|nr:glycosyltransferase family 39 protein [Chloroflexota bacterium]
MVVSTIWPRWARFGLLGVILVSRLVLGTVYSLAQPPLESHDETGHSTYVAYIAAHLALPPPGGKLTPYFGEGHQPPLYYIVPGIIGYVFGITGEYQPPMNPFFLSGNGEHGINAAVHIPAVEAWPWHDGLLLLHIARFWSVLLGVIAVWLTYVIGRWCFPRSSIVPLAGAAYAAFLPTSLGVTDAVTNDALVPVTFGLTFLCSLRLISEPRLRWSVLFGIATGASLLTKNSALILLPYACCIFGLIWWKNRNRQRILRLAFAFAFVVFLVAGWWYLRNFLLYGHWITDRTQTSAIINSLGLQTKEVAYSLHESFAVRLITYTFQSYWVLVGWGTIAAPRQVYWGLFVLSLLTLFGLVRYVVSDLLARRREGIQQRGLIAVGAQGESAYPSELGAVGMLAFFSAAMIPEPLYRAIFYGRVL